MDRGGLANSHAPLHRLTLYLTGACLQTRMSLTGGASWQSLDPPASYRFAQCNTCKAGTPAEQCRLHLHGPTSWFAPEGGFGQL